MKLIKTISICVIISLIAALFESCVDPETDSTTDEVGNWVQTSPFKGPRRSSAIIFTIGDKAYAGLGYDGSDYFSDFYEFDPELGFWKNKSPFPGTGRERAIAFSIGDKGYIGLGYNRDLATEELADFWEYNSTTDVWTRLKNFSGGARYNSVAFAINDRGYVGTGNNGSNNTGDFWEYNPFSDEWQEIPSYPGQKREEASVFVLEGKGYLFGGRNNGLFSEDFWEFNPDGKTWTKRVPDVEEDFYDEFSNAVLRYNAVGFALNGMGYIATGVNSGGNIDNTVWEYNPQTQVWDQMTSFEGSGRSLAIAFVVANKIYVGTGQGGSIRFDDIWEFRPDEEYDDAD